MDLKAGKLKSTWSDQTWYLYGCFSYWKLQTSLDQTICDQRLIPFRLGIISHVTFNSSVTIIVWIFGWSLRFWGNAMVLNPTVKKTLPHCGSMSLKRDILNFCLILLWFRSKVRKQHRSAAAGLYECCLQVWGEVATFSPRCFYSNQAAPSLGVGTRKGSRQLLAAGPNWQLISTQFICILDLYLLKYKYKK